MSVIIRLQNLAWSANALDIRQFFRGLSIPEGGVHIVGGELGDAFIAFSTDEDARQAMMHDGGKIKEMKIKLLLSSRTEMQKVIETARQQTLSLHSFMQTPSSIAVPQALTSQPQQQPQQQQQQQQKSSSPVDTKKDTEIELKDRKERRERSRSRDRSRSRERERDRKDRGRDRDRRRRDRSRSRDRRDRDRGRRRRDRSRSRDRTRSRDRDTRRNAAERRKDIMHEEDTNDIVCVGQFLKDKLADKSNMKGNKNLSNMDNGIWEVPPQNQMQLMLAPGILGAGVAAISHETDSRSIRLNGPTNPSNSLLHSNQFNLNNGIQSHGINSLNLNVMPPGLGSNLARNDRQWSNESSHGRMSDLRYAARATFPSDSSFPYNNSNFRSNTRANHSLINKMQELDGRRNPHAFQSSITQYDNCYGVSNRNGSGTMRFSADKSPGYCIEVRNMPLNASYSDVRHAFHGIYIRKDGLKLINDTHGNRVGIAYIKFNKPEGKEIALSIPRYVRGSEVEVCSLDESIFDKAVDSYCPDRDNDVDDILENFIITDNASSCIHITDLPSFAKEMDIAKLFQDWKINDLFITCKKDISAINKYMAYIQFSRIEDAKLATTTPLKIATKSITAISITEEKFQQAKRAHEQETLGEGSPPDCIVIRALPFNTNETDILDFFSNISLVPRRIHFNHLRSECFCEFDVPEEALKAITKNGTSIGKNIPIIEIIHRNKMIEILNNPDTHTMDLQIPFSLHQQRMSNPPPRFTTAFLPSLNGPRGPPGLMSIPRPVINRHPSLPGFVEGFGKPGCVLSLENVPFKADINEIIEFFSDFDVTRENVIRRYNEKGMPTGDAKVAFSSPSEAQRAARELRNRKVRDRTIYMKIA